MVEKLPRIFCLGAVAAAMSANDVHAETVKNEAHIDAPVEHVWSAVRDPYSVHKLLAPDFIANVVREDDTRIVTFANGFVVKERIVTIDDDARRLAYSAYGGRTTYHMASMQVLEDGDGSRLVWISDFLPADLRPFISGNMDQGMQVMKATLEATAKDVRSGQ